MYYVRLHSSETFVKLCRSGPCAYLAVCNLCYVRSNTEKDRRTLEWTETEHVLALL